jgi:hypothetical protein
MTRLEEIAAREKAATPAPWTFEDFMHRDGETLCVILPENGEPTPVLELDELSDIEVDNNWTFVAHARADVPHLLALVQEEREKVRKLCDAGEAITKAGLHSPVCQCPYCDSVGRLKALIAEAKG